MEEDNLNGQIYETTKLIQQDQKKNTETISSIETEINSIKALLFGSADNDE